MRRYLLCLFLLAACGDDAAAPGDAAAPDSSLPEPDGGPSYILGVSPTQLTARQHVGGPGEPPLVFEFRVPTDLMGGGLPADLTSGATDTAIAEIELPEGRGSTDENAMSSTGLANFDGPLFCTVGTACANAGTDGSWQATVIAPDGSSREVQLAMAMKDLLNKTTYDTVFGVFLPTGDALHAGDRVQLSFIGNVAARATDWTDMPFVAHFRYRSGAGPWTVLDDDQVEPLEILPQAQAKYVRAIAPMDVQVGQPFTVAVVVTDHYGNPRPIRGTVHLSGGVTADVQFTDEWRKELPGVTYADAGFHKIVPQLDGARGIYHYSMAWAQQPPITRLLGDVHSHTGDGGAQRKFIGAFIAGDHRGLYARTTDALRYMHEVAGFDFGAVSEHSVRWDAYQPPPQVAADTEFQTGGACAGAGAPIPALENWWSRHQGIVADFQQQNSGFIALHAFEWHAAHAMVGDRSPLHRIVLFRDLTPDGSLPILPGDIENLSPRCIVRFLSDVGFGSDRALVIPHMMQATDNNIDWELTYSASNIAPRAQVEDYYRIGEIYSARAIDQLRAYGTPTLTVFEGDDTTPGRWTYRNGWRTWGAHVGLIGSSDNHEQMPGVNDDLDLDGVNYHSNEPGGYAVALATTADRGGVWDALRSRRTYATSGVRAWLNFALNGSAMGSRITTASGTTAVTGRIVLAAGLTITHVQLWAVPAGVTGAQYQLLVDDQPAAETYAQTNLSVPNPLAAGAAAQEWLYYVRAFLKTPGSPNDADEAVWSSPIWITWTP